MAKLQAGAIVKQYYYDAAGQMIEATDGSGRVLRAEIFAGARHLATWNSTGGGSTFFNYADWLGTERLRTFGSGSHVGQPCETITSLPFGDGEATQSLNGGCGDPSPNHLTGLQHDSESGLDHTLNRQLSSNIGRWMTPDPGGTKVVKLEDPQTWDMYVYAHDNPTTVTDTSGLCSAPDVAEGDVGICLETYIQRAHFGFGWLGEGDDRGPNPYGGSFRTQTMIDASVSGGTAREKTTAGVSRTLVGPSLRGVAHDWISGVQKAKDGSLSFTVHVYGENGYEAHGVPGAPGGWIEMAITLKVTPGGKVSVVKDKSSAKKFPSMSIYSYDSNGTATSVFQQRESGNINDLNRPSGPLSGDPMKEGAARLCSLGNPAACGF